MTHFRPITIDLPPVPLADQPAPVLDWIKIARLRIDDRYQRPLERRNWDAIRKIAADFRWDRFSAVLVAPIEGGMFAVIDGQHRVHAAALCGIEAVPCVQVPMSQATQAQAFVHVNATVTPISAHHVYRAALAANEGWALSCSTAVQQAGCHLATSNGKTETKKPGQVFAINLVRRMVAAGQADVVTRALTALRRAYQPGSTLHYSGSTLTHWFAAVALVPELTADGLTAFLTGRNILLVIEKATATARASHLPVGPHVRDHLVDRMRAWNMKRVQG